MRKLLSIEIFSINPCYTPDLENIKINPLINQLFIQHKANTKLLIYFDQMVDRIYPTELQLFIQHKANTKLLIYFDQMVDRIYPTELQLNRANSSDTEAAFESMYN